MAELAGFYTNMGLSADLRILVDHLDHNEGVAWDPSRQRVVMGSEAGVIRAVDVNAGTHEVVGQLPGWILGIAVDAHGNHVCCVIAGEQTGVWVSRTDGSTERLNRDPIIFPNYLSFAPDGSLYVTDSGDFGEHNSRVFRIAPDGTQSVVTDAINRCANGCAMHPDGTELWVIESFGPKIFAIDLATGSMREVAYIHGTVLDGMAFCADGSAIVTSYRPDRLYHLLPDGQTRILAEDPFGALLNAPTNCCFIGDDRTRLIATNFGRWHLTEVTPPASGGRLFYPETWAGIR